MSKFSQLKRSAGDVSGTNLDYAEPEVLYTAFVLLRYSASGIAAV